MSRVLKLGNVTLGTENNGKIDLTIPAGYNCFLCGPVDFTGTVNVEGVMNIL